MCPSCSVWILQIVHTVVIKLVLLCPRVTREKLHLERLRNPLQQSPHLQSTSCLRTPLTPSTSRSSSPHSPYSHPSPHCRWENGPICEPPTETELMARACHYCHPEIRNEFGTQKSRILL